MFVILGAVTLMFLSFASLSEARGLTAPKNVCGDHWVRNANHHRSVTKARRMMICYVNYARARKGLRRFKINRKMAWSAKKKARDVLRCGFSHSACGRPFDYWINRAGYRSRRGVATGENIAWGSGALGRVRTIFKAWMHSHGHRSAILDRKYFTEFNVNVARGKLGRYRGALVWVTHFGHRY